MYGDFCADAQTNSNIVEQIAVILAEQNWFF